VRMWNGSPSLAYTAQIVATFSVAVLLIALWHSRASLACKGAGLCLGALLATPYSLDYDMMVLAPAIALMAADGREGGFLPYERVVLAALWLVPIAARFVAGATGFPLGLIVMALGFAFALRRGLKTSVPAVA
jgi:alpha-1,2-mannosyltransferase